MTRVDFSQLAQGAKIPEFDLPKGSADEFGRIKMGFGPKLIFAKLRATDDHRNMTRIGR